MDTVGGKHFLNHFCNRFLIFLTTFLRAGWGGVPPPPPNQEQQSGGGVVQGSGAELARSGELTDRSGGFAHHRVWGDGLWNLLLSAEA